MRQAAKYTWIGYVSARSQFAYAGDVLARTVFLAVVLYIFTRLWLAVYDGTGRERIAGLTMPQMLWYLVATEAITLSSSRSWSEVDQDVRTGRIATKLIHPVSYVLSQMSRTLGERAFRFALNLGVGSAIALVLVGPIRWSLAGLALFLALLPLAFVLDFLCGFLVGLCAFWLESTAGIALLYSRSVMLLGGMLLPVEVYPESMQPLLRWLPFSSMVHAPGRMFAAPDAGLLVDAVLKQGLALILLASVVCSVQGIAMKRLFTNGG